MISLRALGNPFCTLQRQEVKGHAISVINALEGNVVLARRRYIPYEERGQGMKTSMSILEARDCSVSIPWGDYST